jgi:hypothetical protein
MNEKPRPKSASSYKWAELAVKVLAIIAQIIEAIIRH